MKSTKHQAPSTKETSSSKLHASCGAYFPLLEFWNLFGLWMLELGV
jgi:hypothetical protein